jgi:hypothetical protein
MRELRQLLALTNDTSAAFSEWASEADKKVYRRL